MDKIEHLYNFDPDATYKIIEQIKKGKSNIFLFCNKKLIPDYLNYAVDNKRLFDVSSREVECSDRREIVERLNKELVAYNNKTYQMIKEGEAVGSDVRQEIANNLKPLGYNI